MSEIKSLAKHTVIYGFTSVLVRLLNYVLVPLHTRVLSEYDFGIISNLYAYIAIIIIILTFGIETGYFRFSNKRGYSRNEIFNSSFKFIFLSASLFILALYLFENRVTEFLDIKEILIIKFFGWIIFLDVICTIPMANLRNKNMPFRFSLVNMASVIVNITINIIFLWIYKRNGIGNPEFVEKIFEKYTNLEIIFIANLIASGVKAVLLIQEIRIIRIFDRLKYLNEILKYSYPIFLVGLFGIFLMQGDKILLPMFIKGDRAFSILGVYSANYKLTVIMLIFVQMYRYAADPFFFSRIEEKGLNDTIFNTSKLFLIIGWLIILGINLFIDIFKYFIGSNFHEGLYIVPYLLIAYLIYGLFFNISYWYKIGDKTILGILFLGVAALLNFTINIMFIKKLEFEACVIALIAGYSIAFILCYLFGKKSRKLRFPFNDFFFYGILTLGLIYVSNTKLINEIKGIRYIVLSLMFLFFLGIIFIKESKFLREIFYESKNS